MVKKIVIIGPESTGKSSLSKQLANHYQTVWVPEYARQFLLEHGTQYTFNDLLLIAKGQMQLEESIILQAKNNLVFIDTNMYVMKVWSEFVFNDAHQWVLEQISDKEYDLYLLCNVDLPWIKDDLREYPDLEIRKELYHIYKDIMMNQEVPWVEISGNYEERLHAAIIAVDNILKGSAVCHSSK